MNESVSIHEALLQVYEQLLGFVVAAVPRLITGLVVLLIGLVLARVVAWVVRVTLRRVKFDAAMDRVGIAPMLQSIGLKGSLGDSIAKAFYYVLFILFARGAAQSAGLLVISHAIDSFFGYLPRMIAALLIVLLGNLVGQFARSMIEQSARDSGLDYAPALGRAVSGGVLFVVAIMAISQLGIDTAMIQTVVIAGLAAGTLAFGLSFGLGTREVTRHIIAGFYVRKLFRAGDPVEIDGFRGNVGGVTATKTLIEGEDATLAVANARMLEEDVRA